jgi:hypothetical protein
LKKILVDIVKFSLFLGIGVAIMMWFYNNQNTAFQEQLRLEGKQPYPLIDKLINDFRSVNLFWIAMTLLAFSISNWSRAIRWNMLIHPLGYQFVFCGQYQLFYQSLDVSGGGVCAGGVIGTGRGYVGY